MDSKRVYTSTSATQRPRDNSVEEWNRVGDLRQSLRLSKLPTPRTFGARLASPAPSLELTLDSFFAAQKAATEKQWKKLSKVLLDFEKRDPRTFDCSGWAADSVLRLLAPSEFDLHVKKAAEYYIRARFRWLFRRAFNSDREMKLYDYATLLERRVIEDWSGFDLTKEDLGVSRKVVDPAMHWRRAIREARQSKASPEKFKADESCNSLTLPRLKILFRLARAHPNVAEPKIIDRTLAQLAGVSVRKFTGCRARLHGNPRMQKRV